MKKLNYKKITFIILSIFSIFIVSCANGPIEETNYVSDKTSFESYISSKWETTESPRESFSGHYSDSSPFIETSADDESESKSTVTIPSATPKPTPVATPVATPTVPAATPTIEQTPIPEVFKGERVLFDVYKPQDDTLSFPLLLPRGTIRTGTITGSVKREIFGTHMSFFNEEKRLRDMDNYIPMLEEFNFGLLRFPGGEESDNYLWETQTVYRSDWFYHRSTDQDLHTDEFFEICRKLGAEPIIVLNYDYAHDAPNEQERNERLFEYNKRWAEYIVEQGYSVRYFELGNEVVYSDYKFPGNEITVEQYAQDYLTMREILREIDPGFQLGANMYAYYDGENWSEASKVWADTFFEIVGNNCDFVSPHLYYGQIIRNDFEKTRYKLDEVVLDWREKTKAKTGQEVDVMLSEWNLWIRNDKIRLGNFGHGMVLADGIFGLAKGGAKGSNVWPLHWYNPSTDTYHYFNNVEYGLLKKADNSFTTAGYVFSELSKEMQGYEILQMDMGWSLTNNERSHIALISPERDRIKIIVGNYSMSRAVDMGFIVDGIQINNITSKTLIADNNDIYQPSDAEYINPKAVTDGSRIRVTLPPYSLTFILCDVS